MFRPRLYEKLTHTATEKVDVSEPSPSQPPQRSVLRRKALNTELANATSGKLKNPLEVIKETVEKLGQGSEEDAEEDPEDESRRQEVKYTNPLKQTDVLEVWFAGCHSGKSRAFTFIAFSKSRPLPKMLAEARYPTKRDTV